MSDCKDLKSAEIYLRNHNYAEVQPHEDGPTIGYRGRSGDSTWEDHVAGENDWFKQEHSKCCIRNAKDNPTHKYCYDCGTGINGTLTWTKSSQRSGEIEALEKALEQPCTCDN